ncbi:MAG: pyridoxal phosphate-dependent aminotransferase, partial [candidate division WOR-3 bacterium]
VAQEELSRFTARLQEHLVGLRVLRAFACEEQEKKTLGELNLAYFRASQRLVNVQALFFPLLQFLIGVGASEALIFLFMTCCDPGDDIIVFDPTYANYLGFAAISGVHLVPVLSRMDNNFAVPGRSEIARKITDRTRAILVCSPNNPTGTVCTEEELRFLYDLCEERNLFLMVDETYREFVYDDLKPLSILHLFPKSERVVVIDSLSKRFSLCGARIGCMITCNEEILAAALKIAQARLAAPTIEQFAAAHMLDSIGDDYLKNARLEFQSRRDALYQNLREIPGVVVHKPQGAFYSVVQLPVDDADDFASFLLSSFSHKGKTTFIAPAAGFYIDGSQGRQQARFAYVLQRSEIVGAIEALAAGLESYRRR